MYITISVLILSAAFFVWGKIRSDIVALLALLALLLTKILTVEEALSGFSNSIVIMMAALFVVGGGIFQTGLARMISSKILSLAGSMGRMMTLIGTPPNLIIHGTLVDAASELIHKPLKELDIDVLLIQGKWEDIHQLEGESSEWVMVIVLPLLFPF
ncbi:hypothetical protein FACS189421_01350 [Bacteroidia bacterium]|nr:hypothetical protein FACS189421_01350 [Bacteroidia bacterium]GHT46075.1 hypothetical protein FACS189440_03320 [Bacteroidia bacterium]